LHVALIGGVSWRLPQEDLPVEPMPFDARLVSVAAPGVMMPPQPLPATKPPAPKPPVRIVPRPVANPPEAPDPPVAVPAEPIAASASVEAAANIDAASVTQHEPGPVEEPHPPLNQLPSRIDLRFQVNYGLASGEQTMVWVNEGGHHYTVISVAEATGLAGMFYRGKFVQTSRGRITPQGLQPEEFWDQRGDKRSSAHFDAAQGHLTLVPDKGTPRNFSYQGDVQDVLSLFFQLALTAPPQDGLLAYTVFNGKKLRNYAYEVRGTETLETALGALRTLHLARVADGDGRFEVWLAIDRHYLPVRMLRTDDKGSEMELRVQSIAP